MKLKGKLTLWFISLMLIWSAGKKGFLSFDSVLPYVLAAFSYKFVRAFSLKPFGLKKEELKVEFSMKWLCGAFLLAALTVLGKFRTIAECVGEHSFSVRTITWIFVYFISFCVIYYLCIWIMDASLMDVFSLIMVESNEKSASKEFEKSLSFRWIFIFAVVCIICWLPYFINYYPGILTNDSINELNQIFSGKYSNHHPWIHVMVIRLFYGIGFNITNTSVGGVASYTIASMLIMAFIYSIAVNYACYRLNGEINWKIYILGIIFYALIPINAMYSITMWKDIFFSGFMLLFVIWLDAKENLMLEGRKRLVGWMLYGILALLICLFRSNGKFAFLLLVPIIGIKFKKQMKCFIISTGCVFACIFIYSNIIMPFFEVEQPDMVEWLSVPEQQIAYTIFQGGDISAEEYLKLNRIVPVNKVADTYNSGLSDPIKNLIRREGNQKYLKEHVKEYLSLYISIGRKNIYSYITAFAEQSKGYWYHRVTNWICSLGIVDNDLEIKRTALIDYECGHILDNCIEYLVEKATFVFNNYFSLALNSYFVIVSLVISWKREKSIAAYLPLLALLFTLMLATPVNSEFRYTYAIYISLPVLFIITVADLKDCN